MQILPSSKAGSIAIVLVTILMLLSILSQTNLTQTTQPSSASSAPVTQPTPPANELEECSQLLDKSLSEASACKTLALSRLDEINALKADKAINDQMKIRYEKIIADADARIEILNKIKCSKVSIFWGLFSIRQC